MENGPISKVTRQVLRTFPEMEGVEPTVRPQPAADVPQFVLTYKGKALTRIVRVIADERGQVLRISTSR